ncbi:MAG: DUF2309 domain-containing protein [Planctomycetaceae bacterium]|nr:DUF2309 domain-containing protein [Planctomycetaceae bacterium]
MSTSESQSAVCAVATPAEENALDQITRQIREAAEFLPPQGPITGFTFLNPLGALESIPFDDALRQVPDIFGCQPYLSEATYRRMLNQGRIQERELRVVLQEDMNHSADDMVAGLVSRLDFRFSVLLNSLLTDEAADLRWLLLETDVLTRFRTEVSEENRTQLVSEARQYAAGLKTPPPTQELAKLLTKARSSRSENTTWEEICLRFMWQCCCDGVQQVSMRPVHQQCPPRSRDLILRCTGVDPDELVHEVLIQFCATFLDQGFAEWNVVDRDAGFLESFCQLFLSPEPLRRPWLSGLPQELQRLRTSCQTPVEWIRDSLVHLRVDESCQADFLRSTLLALKGYAGMLWQTESRRDRVRLASPSGTLLEFVAVRLLLDRLALKHVARKEMQWTGTTAELQQELCRRFPKYRTPDRDQFAYRLFQCAQFVGWGPLTLSRLKPSDWKELIQELTEFNGLERRRIFHGAFERRYAVGAMDAVALRLNQPPIRPEKPLLQVVTCIDAREESFRRLMEEVSPEVETFGAAGFFGIPIYYRGLGDAGFTVLCPPVVTPQYWVVEDPVYSMEEVTRARAKARRFLGSATHILLGETKRSVGGAIVSALLGPLATAPLVGCTIFPGATARLHSAARHFVAPPRVSRLRLDRDESEAPGPGPGQIGFTVDEMVRMGGKILRDIGLTENFAPIVLLLGHGSSCVNNPHKSAYHCGACSGGVGAPNARTAAAMLNDSRVRKRLAAEGLQIPDETHFLGGMHNTGTDEITFFDLELLPGRQTKNLLKIRDILSRTCELNAQERCRRFESAEFDIDPVAAMVHVQDRSQNLAETRPEYGNCTNSMCFVGRRERIRGLYMDRRSFLQSYDPTQDDADSSILAGTLSAVIPVCEGINLLYTLSAIDPFGWGAGSKLPHNATSMLGVMDGAASDLRVGLPWQGVDIHEPMRLLFIIETTPEAMLQIMENNPTINRICRGHWAQLAVLDPDSATIRYFTNGEFVEHQLHQRELPTAASSVDWYRGSREHLPFAIIGAP